MYKRIFIEQLQTYNYMFRYYYMYKSNIFYIFIKILLYLKVINASFKIIRGSFL